MQKILKNSGGKILRNQVGKVMRQNYNMSQYFQVDMPNNLFNHLRIEHPFGVGNPIPPQFSIITRTNPNIYSELNKAGIWRIGSADNPVILSASGRYAVNHQVFCNKTSELDHVNTETIGTTKIEIGFLDVGNYGVVSHVIDDVNKHYYSYAGDYNYNATFSNIIRQDVITEFILGRSSRGTKSYEMPESNVGFYELLVYDRLISEEEHQHFWNLGKGNNPISDVNLLFRIRCDKVEILDFSQAQDGSDMRVGIPDLSNNHRHAEIVDLPAGTLEEQRDYAQNTFIIKSYPPRY